MAIRICRRVVLQDWRLRMHSLRPIGRMVVFRKPGSPAGPFKAEAHPYIYH